MELLHEDNATIIRICKRKLLFITRIFSCKPDLLAIYKADDMSAGYRASFRLDVFIYQRKDLFAH